MNHSVDWGFLIGSILTALSAAGLGAWAVKKRKAISASIKKRRAIKDAQARLPEALGKLCGGLRDVTASLESVQASVASNTRALAHLSAYTRGAVETSSTPQCWFDDGGQLVNCNKAFESLFGKSRAELKGFGYHVLMDGDHVRRFMTEHKWMARHKRNREGRSRMRDAAGQLVTIDFKIAPAYKTADDDVKLFLCVLEIIDDDDDAAVWSPS